MEIRSRTAQTNSAFTNNKEILCCYYIIIGEEALNQNEHEHAWSKAQYTDQTLIAIMAEKKIHKGFEMWCLRRMLQIN